MVEVRKYNLAPTALIPNSPHPLLHYPGLLASDSERAPEHVYDLLSSHGWQVQWIYRYGKTQDSHYHSEAHECMAVLSGSATIRFGVADTSSNLEESTYGSAKEDGGIEVNANVGDVFVLPAGLAHKTFNTNPPDEFKLLTPGDGHRISDENVRDKLAGVQLSGFTMVGGYPYNSKQWDFAKGGEHSGAYEKVWAVAKPEHDPVLGKSEDGLCGQWH